MKQVICTGTAVLDHIFQLSKIPQTPTKSFAKDYTITSGGNASTAAIALSCAGGRSIFWGVIGDDYNGDLILKNLTKFNVDVQNVQRLPGVNSGISTVLIDDKGERLVIHYSDQKLFSNADWLPLERLKESDAVLVDWRWPKGAMKVLSKAHELGIPSVLDADLNPQSLNEDVISLATHVLFSKPALKEFGGENIVTALKCAKELNKGWVGVTDGSGGTYWLETLGKHCDALRHFPAFKVKTLNTLGAGDVFHGVFTLCLAEGNSEENAIRIASAAAAIHCSKAPYRHKSIPNRNSIDKFIKENA
tara:strand:+ start:270 stop:1184 length:915 start_codon:yes stop_codon:yes gene_type:complete